MTATFFLVRHAVHDLLDKVLVGHAPHVSLSDEGRRQAYRLAVRLARERLTAVYASPRNAPRRPHSDRQCNRPVVETSLSPQKFGTPLDRLPNTP